MSSVLQDPVEAFIATLRAQVEVFRPQFESGELTGFETESKYEKDLGWMVEVKPVVNSKVKRAWARK